MNHVCLIEQNVFLVPYCLEHDNQTVEWLNSPELRETFGLSRPVTRESHRQWVEQSRNVLIWAIVVEQFNHIGNVLLHCAWAHRSAYFQIYIGNSQSRGQRVGTSALKAVLSYGFFDLDLHRIWLHTLNSNTRAERMYRSAGFTLEGVEREAIMREGVFYSQSRWSVLESEWRRKANESHS